MTPLKTLSILQATAAVMLLTTCSPTLYAPTASDSVRVEFRERIVRDTAYIEVPREVERIITHDTTSTLENRLSKSTATVTDGELHHCLETKPQTLAAPVSISVCDTVWLESETITVTEYKERELTRWQRFKQECGALLLGLLAAALVYIILRLVKH